MERQMELGTDNFGLGLSSFVKRPFYGAMRIQKKILNSCS